MSHSEEPRPWTFYASVPLSELISDVRLSDLSMSDPHLKTYHFNITSNTNYEHDFHNLFYDPMIFPEERGIDLQNQVLGNFIVRKIKIPDNPTRTMPPNDAYELAKEFVLVRNGIYGILADESETLVQLEGMHRLVKKKLVEGMAREENFLGDVQECCNWYENQEPGSQGRTSAYKVLKNFLRMDEVEETDDCSHSGENEVTMGDHEMSEEEAKDENKDEDETGGEEDADATDSNNEGEGAYEHEATYEDASVYEDASHHEDEGLREDEGLSETDNNGWNEDFKIEKLQNANSCHEDEDNNNDDLHLYNKIETLQVKLDSVENTLTSLMQDLESLHTWREEHIQAFNDHEHKLKYQEDKLEEVDQIVFEQRHKLDDMDGKLAEHMHELRVHENDDLPAKLQQREEDQLPEEIEAAVLDASVAIGSTPCPSPEESQPVVDDAESQAAEEEDWDILNEQGGDA